MTDKIEETWIESPRISQNELKIQNTLNRDSATKASKQSDWNRATKMPVLSYGQLHNTTSCCEWSADRKAAADHASVDYQNRHRWVQVTQGR